MIHWGQENGASVNDMKIVNYTKDWRGVHAAHRIKKDQRIASFKDSVLLGETRAVADSELAKKVLSSGVKLKNPFFTAVACLVHEARKDPKHFWHFYARSFPDDLSTYPYFFTEKEHEWLKGTSFQGI